MLQMLFCYIIRFTYWTNTSQPPKLRTKYHAPKCSLKSITIINTQIKQRPQRNHRHHQKRKLYLPIFPNWPWFSYNDGRAILEFRHACQVTTKGELMKDCLEFPSHPITSELWGLGSRRKVFLLSFMGLTCNLLTEVSCKPQSPEGKRRRNGDVSVLE